MIASTVLAARLTGALVVLAAILAGVSQAARAEQTPHAAQTEAETSPIPRARRGFNNCAKLWM